MLSMSNEVTTYTVTCRIAGGPKQARRVAVGATSNHTTSFSDIPTIIAVATIGAHRVSEVEILSAVAEVEG